MNPYYAQWRCGGDGIFYSPAIGILEKSGLGESIKDTLRLRGLSYQKLADRLNELGITDQHGIGVSKDRVASYVLERNRPPKWFLDGIIVALGLPKNHFEDLRSGVRETTDRQTASDKMRSSTSGIRMRTVPLLHMWESARLHESMNRLGAWDGEVIDVPDFFEDTDLMCVRLNSDGYRPLLERGDAFPVEPGAALRFDHDFLVTVIDGGHPDIARCVRGGKGTLLYLLNGKRAVDPSEVHNEAMVVGLFPQYIPTRPKGAFDPDGFVLPGEFPGLL